MCRFRKRKRVTATMLPNWLVKRCTTNLMPCWVTMVAFYLPPLLREMDLENESTRRARRRRTSSWDVNHNINNFSMINKQVNQYINKTTMWPNYSFLYFSFKILRQLCHCLFHGSSSYHCQSQFEYNASIFLSKPPKNGNSNPKTQCKGKLQI